MFLGRYVVALAVMGSVVMNPVSGQAETIQIIIDKLVFSPTETKASVGDTIEWVNNDVLIHTATARNGDWDVVIAAKKTSSLVLKNVGSIDYYCRYHPNMTGRIVVDPK
jgi:plastocyanin